MPVIMEKRIVITLQDIQGLAFQCQKCKAKLQVLRNFEGLKFGIAQSKVQKCPACGESWLESRDEQSVANKDREQADKVLEAFDYFKRRDSDKVPWRILLDLPGDLD